MNEPVILLLRPAEESPAAIDQAAGARLAALAGRLKGQVVLEEDSFPLGSPEGLGRALRRWIGKISGVVGATSVAESARLGALAEDLDLLCFVANNDRAVWQGRKHVFHIGVPTSMTSQALAELLLTVVGEWKRVFLLHDETLFQRKAARAAEASLATKGFESCCHSGSRDSWLEGVASWKPDLLYLVYSEESLALELARRSRAAFPDLPLLGGRSLLRDSFIASLGDQADGFLFLDIFHRSAPRAEEEALFMRSLSRARIEIPTANHGFGWDAMMLCGIALIQARSGGFARGRISGIRTPARGRDRHLPVQLRGSQRA